MTETSSRLLEMLSLLQGRRDWPGSELADRLEVSGRTIRRDVERLRRLGYPVESLTGPAGGYRLRAGSAMPPLLLELGFILLAVALWRYGRVLGELLQIIDKPPLEALSWLARKAPGVGGLQKWAGEKLASLNASLEAARFKEARS